MHNIVCSFISSLVDFLYRLSLYKLYLMKITITYTIHNLYFVYVTLPKFLLLFHYFCFIFYEYTYLSVCSAAGGKMFLRGVVAGGLDTTQKVTRNI